MKRSAILAGLVLVGYWQALDIGFLSDDFVHITGARQNTLSLRLFAVPPDWVFYRPLGTVAWLLQERLFGYEPMPYHLASLCLHGLSSILVMTLASRLAPGREALAFGSGAIFALLPLHLEAVGWLAAQYDLLATLGVLASLVCLIESWRKRSPALYVLSLAAYQLALWSKETAFSFPALAMLLAWAVLKRPQWRLAAASLSGHAILLGVNLALRFQTWGAIGGYQGVSHDYPSFAWDHLASAFAVMLAPFNRLLFPAALVQIWLLAMSALVVAGLMTGRNRRTIATSLAWIAITTLPALALLPVGAGLDGSRLLYLPAVGFALGLAALIDALAQEFVPARRHQAVYLATGLLAAAYVALITVQIKPWLVATRVAREVVDDLHQLVPSFAPGSLLQVEGLPDIYQGAYVFRLGFDHQFGQRYGSGFVLEQVDSLGSLEQDNEFANTYQVAYAFDADQSRWPLVTARAVTEPGSEWPEPPAGGIQWDFRQCGAAAGWTLSDASLTCEPGTGLRLAPNTADPYLMSPTLDLVSNKWLEVRAEIGTEPGVRSGAAAQLFWHAPSDWFDEARSIRIDLPRSGGQRNYHFFVPPYASGEAVSQIRLDPVDGIVPAVVVRMAVRAVP